MKCWHLLIFFFFACYDSYWWQDPSLAESLCLACPPGASCPGGADVVPLSDFWTEPVLSGATGSRRSATNTQVEVIWCTWVLCWAWGWWYDQTTSSWWTDASDSMQIYRCPAGACTGGGNCTPGRTGAVCGLCRCLLIYCWKVNPCLHISVSIL